MLLVKLLRHMPPMMHLLKRLLKLTQSSLTLLDQKPQTSQNQLFQPKAWASPSFTRNRNFTSNLLQSYMPKMKNHLNSHGMNTTGILY